jgi:hypothetical protein
MSEFGSTDRICTRTIELGGLEDGGVEVGHWAKAMGQWLTIAKPKNIRNVSVDILFTEVRFVFIAFSDF